MTLPKPGCVLKVGEGRGFIIEKRVRISVPRLPASGNNFHPRTFIQRRLIVTAAHCLPKLPPAHAFSYSEERTYKNLLGSLGSSKTDVWAECLFVDPVSDIAVLDCPDEQDLDEQADTYHALIDEAPVVRIGTKPSSGPGWVLTLEGEWTRTMLSMFSGIGVSLSIGPTKPGMSGSPILNDAGRAIGVVALGGETINSEGERKDDEKCGPQPILTRNLPGWLL